MKKKKKKKKKKEEEEEEETYAEYFLSLYYPYFHTSYMK